MNSQEVEAKIEEWVQAIRECRWDDVEGIVDVLEAELVPVTPKQVLKVLMPYIYPDAFGLSKVSVLAFIQKAQKVDVGVVRDLAALWDDMIADGESMQDIERAGRDLVYQESLTLEEVLEVARWVN